MDEKTRLGLIETIHALAIGEERLLRIASEIAASDEEIHKEAAAQRQGTVQSLDRFWENLPGYKADELSGIVGRHGRY